LLLTLTDASGAKVASKSAKNGTSLSVFLHQGTYVIQVSGWLPAAAAGLAYHLKITLGGSPENPQPLTLGPAPALRLQLRDPPVAAPLPASNRVPVPTSNPRQAGILVESPPANAPSPVLSPILVLGAVRVDPPSSLLTALGTMPVGGVSITEGTGGQQLPLLTLRGLDRATPSGVGLQTETVGEPAQARETARLGGGELPGADPALVFASWARGLTAAVKWFGEQPRGLEIENAPPAGEENEEALVEPEPSLVGDEGWLLWRIQPEAWLTAVILGGALLAIGYRPFRRALPRPGPDVRAVGC
jgi:hypothetical protein